MGVALSPPAIRALASAMGSLRCAHTPSQRFGGMPFALPKAPASDRHAGAFSLLRSDVETTKDDPLIARGVLILLRTFAQPG